MAKTRDCNIYYEKEVNGEIMLTVVNTSKPSVFVTISGNPDLGAFYDVPVAVQENKDFALRLFLRYLSQTGWRQITPAEFVQHNGGDTHMGAVH